MVITAVYEKYVCGIQNQLITTYCISGMEAHDMESKTKVAQMIEKIDNDFHLVLIVEKMDESLILLKDLVCWNFLDIRYFRLNERSEDTKKSQMTTKTRARLKQWLWADYKLYNHFKEKLHQLIFEFGIKKMENQVQTLKTLNVELKKKLPYD